MEEIDEYEYELRREWEIEKQNEYEIESEIEQEITKDYILGELRLEEILEGE